MENLNRQEKRQDHEYRDREKELDRIRHKS